MSVAEQLTPQQQHMEQPRKSVMEREASEFASGDDSIDLKEYLDLFYRRRWLMIGTVLVVLLLGMIYTLVETPVYESTAEILVTSNKETEGRARPSVAVRFASLDGGTLGGYASGDPLQSGSAR